MFKRLRRYFFTGLLVAAPLFISVSFALWLVDFIDSRIVPLIPEHLNPNTWFKRYFGVEFGLPGFGVIALLVFITLIGAVTTGFLGRVITSTIDGVISKMPIIRTVYYGVKQIIQTFTRNDRQAYKKPLLVEFPRKGVWAIGFLTGDCPSGILGAESGDWISVYVPTTPNPTGGYLVFYRRDEVREIDLTTEEAFKYVVSTGVIDPKTEEKTPDVRDPSDTR